MHEPKKKLTDVAYQLLEEAIVTLRLPPGSVVSEQALVEMTGIGRTRCAACFPPPFAFLRDVAALVRKA